MKNLTSSTVTNYTPPVGIIGKGIEIRGSLSGEEALTVEGKITGEIYLSNHLTIEESAEIKANIEVEELTAHGTMEGKIQCSQIAKISSTAIINGELYAPKIIMEEGARFNGRIEMDFELPEGI